MTTFTYVPLYGVNLTKAPKVRKAQFGDGYQQRTADGINYNGRVWAVTFEDTKENIELIDTFLSTEDGITSFDWVPPTGATGKWLCPTWKVTAVAYGKWILSATFEEVFGE